MKLCMVAAIGPSPRRRGLDECGRDGVAEGQRNLFALL